MREGGFSHRLQYAGVRTAAWIVNALPLRAALAMGSCLGWFCWRVLGLRRSVSLVNIGQAFPDMTEKAADRVGLDSYRNAGRFMAEFARQSRMGRAYCEKYISVEPTEALEEVMNCPTGLIGLSFHFGNWEYTGIVMAFRGADVSFLVGEQRNRLVDRYINSLRSAHGIRLLTRDAAMRGIAGIARRGGMACWLSDQDAGRNGITVPFFGFPASTPRGAAAFSVKLNIPIACCFMVRRKGPYQTCVMREVLHPRRDLPREEAEREITERYTRVLEEAVREAPDHYWWAHRRWKTTGLYRKGRREAGADGSPTGS